MSGSTILFDMDGDVAVLHLNRPEQLNALTLPMLDAIPDRIDTAVKRGARAILVAAKGRAFSSGADLLASDGIGQEDLGEVLRDHFNPVIAAFAASPIPIVTAINGPAAGAGASIALAGDIIVAARSSYLLLAFANIGLVPDSGASWLVAKAAGRAKVLEMALLGERLSADAALEAGLITRVVDDLALFDEALALARKLAAMPTIALGLIRKQVMLALTGTLAETMAIEADHQRIAAHADDFREGIAAFAQKRPPTFTGT